MKFCICKFYQSNLTRQYKHNRRHSVKACVCSTVKPICITANQTLSNIGTMQCVDHYRDKLVDYSCPLNNVMFSFRNIRLSKLMIAGLRLRALKSPHKDITRSTYTCEAGHDAISIRHNLLHTLRSKNSHNFMSSIHR
jgi:hypothetical protein